MDYKDKAHQKFLDGYACSQAIFSVYCQEYGVDQDIALRLSTGFGGGLCLGKTCGVVTGAIMIFGLEFGGEHPEKSEERNKVKEAVRAFAREFTEVHGSIECRELLGVDISTPEGLEEAKKNNMFQTKCPAFIQAAACILDNLRNNK